MKLDGYITHIVYHNEENGYTVFSLQVSRVDTQEEETGAEDFTDEEITVVGTFPELNEGEYVSVSGEIAVHASYGQQFKCSGVDFLLPPDAEAAERYLSNAGIKGIGKGLAKRIVKKFGDRTFEVLENEPERLAEVKGISREKAREITDAIVEKRDSRRAILFLGEYGIGMTLAMKAYNTYSSGLFQIVKENPYRLADEIDGIGFQTADVIAQKNGISLDSEFRIRSGVLFCIRQSALLFGHTCMPRQQLAEESARMLQLPEDVVDIEIINLVMQKQLILKENAEVEMIYLALYYYMELKVARKLLDLNEKLAAEDDTIDLLSQLEEQEKLNLDMVQRDAVLMAMEYGLMIVTGGPGTGKTTTINTIIKLFEQKGMAVMLAAPTGRAARRMKEATGREAQTIHRLLEVSGRGAGDHAPVSFERNEDNPLECDAVIVDEASMIDIGLMNALLQAIPIGVRLILVGDVNQLPSVGPGNVLRDIIDSKVCTVVRLNRIFRQAKESDIVQNAHKIQRGEMVEPKSGSRDFLFVKRDDIPHIQGATKTLLSDKLPGYLHVDMNEIQVLAPMRKGPLGIEGMNRYLQQYLNPPAPDKREKAYGDYIFREGDKVMQVKNNYQLDWEIRNSRGIPVEQGSGIFNGDTGIITEINLYMKEVTVLFEEGRRAVYTFDMLDELEPAYAITIHKAQGSEYPAVIIPLLGGPKMLLNRNLLYTAITRAKSCVTIVGSVETFQTMIRNESENRRYSGLRERILETVSGGNKYL